MRVAAAGVRRDQSRTDHGTRCALRTCRSLVRTNETFSLPVEPQSQHICAFRSRLPFDRLTHDRTIEHGAELWRWLGDGGQIFVCGDASRMAKDVDAALHTVVETHGGMDADAARDFVAQLHDDRRYHRDVY